MILKGAHAVEVTEQMQPKKKGCCQKCCDFFWGRNHIKKSIMSSDSSTDEFYNNLPLHEDDIIDAFQQKRSLISRETQSTGHFDIRDAFQQKTSLISCKTQSTGHFQSLPPQGTEGGLQQTPSISGEMKSERYFEAGSKN